MLNRGHISKFVQRQTKTKRNEGHRNLYLMMTNGNVRFDEIDGDNNVGWWESGCLTVQFSPKLCDTNCSKDFADEF